MDKTVSSKSLYKMFLAIVKYIPLTLAIIQIFGLILNMLGITTAFLSFVGGTSLIFILMLYVFSYVFRFCYLYRISLYYVTIINILFAVKVFIGFSIEMLLLLHIHFFIAGLFTLLFIGYAYKNRNNPNNKIYYIKDLCERYCKY